MATIDFIYDYPYADFGKNGRFQTQWSESTKKLNGSYTYPMIFNTTVPGCRHIKISIEIVNSGSGTVYNRSWDFMVQKSSGTWVDIETFTLPETGLYTVDCDIDNLDITMFAFVPSSNPGSTRSWSSWFKLEQLTITESLELHKLNTGTFQYGVFTNRRGIQQELSEIYVNMGSSLVRATDILINVNGSLQSVTPVYSIHHKSESDSMLLTTFTPNASGTYRICQKDISGDHELRLYSSNFTPVYDDYFYNMSFELTAGALYYISITHYRGADTSESYLQIYKEA